MKFILDPSVVPKVMLDIDNMKILIVEQTINQFFPDDNSIINSETYSVGGVPYMQSTVYKDKYVFGIKPVTENSYLDTPK